MSVELSPQELGFRRPFNHEVTQVLRLANNNSGSVAFKVKTTAPKQYCVRPNSGLIKPNDSVEVQVLLQAMKEDPPLDARCRDKFLVQSVQVDDSLESNVATLWSNVERTNKGSILEQKIRVQFLPAGGSGSTGSNGSSYVNGGATSIYSNVTSSEEPPAYSSPTQAYGSPARASSSDAKSPSMAESTRSTASNAADATGFSGAAAAVSNAMPRSQEDVNQQLSAAQARIKDLTNQLSDPQVRQRKVAETQEKVQQVVQQAQDTGVPLHIVAALCLVSFLIAYMFF